MPEVVGLLGWLLSVAALLFFARNVAGACFPDPLSRRLAGGLGLAAAIVVLAEILSAFGLLASRPAWCWGSLGFALASHFLPAKPRFVSVKKTSRPFRRPAFLLMGAAYLGLFSVAVFLPPNNWDSMTYHLSRIGYYLQQGSLEHFATGNDRQTVFPVNAELAMLWTVVFIRSDQLAALPQYCAALGAACGAFGIARRLSIPRGLASFAALVVLGLPQIALQATSTQNDLFTAWLVASAVYFLLDFAQTRRFVSIGWAGAALGLAVGAKPTAWLFIPGLAILWWAASERGGARNLRNAGWVICAASIGVLLFAAPHWLRNRRATGTLLPQNSSARVAHVSLAGFAANVARNGFDLVDANDLPYPANRAVGYAKRATLGRLFADARRLNPPAATFPGEPYKFAGNILCEDTAWFGFSGLWIVLMALYLFARRSVKSRKLRFAYVLLPLSYAFFHCLLLRWQPWGGRLFCAAMVLTVPPAIWGFRLFLRHKRRRTRRWAWSLWLAVALSGAWTALLQNELKPLHGREKIPSIWSLTANQQRCRRRPYNEAVLEYLASQTPERVGFCGDEDQWDYLAFLPDFRRRVFRYGDELHWRKIQVRDGCVVVFVQRNYYRGTFPQNAVVRELNDYWLAVEF
jgi:4-amino-4-deoxy-L-arabinose transferase-like glycosyltransferase